MNEQKEKDMVKKREMRDVGKNKEESDNNIEENSARKKIY